MTFPPGWRAKAAEWIRRYAPSEISGTVAELGAAGVVYWASGSLASAAIAGTLGASIGYYASAFLAAVRSYRRTVAVATPWRRGRIVALATRSVIIEFGPAELIDSVLIRPAAFYLGPIAFGNVVVGWIVGKIFADIGFYLCAICSYEWFTALLAPRRSPATHIAPTGGTHGSVDPVSAS